MPIGNWATLGGCIPRGFFFGFLDRISQSGISTIVIIHGHGTGALKEAIRDNLKSSGYGVNFRPGEHGEGGDGVTIVQI